MIDKLEKSIKSKEEAIIKASKIIEKKLKEIINYLAFQSQIQKQMLVKMDTNNKLLQTLLNKQSKEELERWQQ